MYLKQQYFYVLIAQQQLWMMSEHLFLNGVAMLVLLYTEQYERMPMTDTNEPGFQ